VCFGPDFAAATTERLLLIQGVHPTRLALRTRLVRSRGGSGASAPCAPGSNSDVVESRHTKSLTTCPNDPKRERDETRRRARCHCPARPIAAVFDDGSSNGTVGTAAIYRGGRLAIRITSSCRK